MNSFRVWIRPGGDFCHVRVDGLENLRWLLGQLSQFFVFRTFEPIGKLVDSQHWTFDVPCNPPLTQAGLRNLLKAMPEVQLMREPA
jgi:hypothetical protein